MTAVADSPAGAGREAAGKVAFELVSPERRLVARDVEMVVVPGAEGDFGVLPGHAPFLSQVRSGVIEVHDDGAVSDRIFVAGGFAEAAPDRCVVLAEEAFPLAGVTRDAARERLAEAARRVDEARDETGRARAEAARAVAAALIEAVEYYVD